MNKIQKTYAILTWILAVGKDLSSAKREQVLDAKNDDFLKVKDAGQKIYDATYQAITMFPKINLKKRNLDKIEEAVKWFDSIGYVKHKQKRAEVMAGLMVLLVEDLLTHIVEEKRKKALENILDALMELSIIIDPELEMTQHYIRSDYAFQRFIKK
jgi:hypothetical protein